MISLIAAIAANGVIGKDNKIPWYCSEDLRFFKITTQNKICLGGKSTVENLPEIARQNRLWYKLSRNPSRYNWDELKIDDIQYAFRATTPFWDTHSGPDHESFYRSLDIMVCGGAKIYKEFLDRDWVDRMYLTYIPDEYDGDTFFPEYDNSIFKLSYIIPLVKGFTPHNDVEVYVYDRK